MPWRFRRWTTWRGTSSIAVRRARRRLVRLHDEVEVLPSQVGPVAGILEHGLTKSTCIPLHFLQPAGKADDCISVMQHLVNPVQVRLIGVPGPCSEVARGDYLGRYTATAILGRLMEEHIEAAL